MSSDVIKLTVPSDSLTFNIGKKDYTVSFADKSFAIFTDQYSEIKMAEVKLQQDLQHRSVELTDKEAQLENDMVNEPMTELNHKKQLLQRRYLRIYDEIQNKYKLAAKERFYKLLDDMFGKGAAKEIYHICNDSMMVLAKVVAQIMVNIEQHTDIQDYRDKYLQSITELRDHEQAKE